MIKVPKYRFTKRATDGRPRPITLPTERSKTSSLLILPVVLEMDFMLTTSI